MTALDNLRRLAAELHAAREGITGRDTRAVAHVLASVIAEFEQRERPVYDCVFNRARYAQPCDRCPAERERKVERLIAAGDYLALCLTAAHKGDTGAAKDWRKAVEDLQADSPPPIARDPVQDAPRRFWT